MELSELKPESVFYYFSEICKVPRPSKKEEKIISYLENFAAEQKLEIKTQLLNTIQSSKNRISVLSINKPFIPKKKVSQEQLQMNCICLMRITLQ